LATSQHESGERRITVKKSGAPNPILEAIREMAKQDAQDPEAQKRFWELKRKRSGEANEPVVREIVTRVQR
jgi:hypothetical protein